MLTIKPYWSNLVTNSLLKNVDNCGNKGISLWTHIYHQSYKEELP